MPSGKKVTLRGSERKPLKGARVKGPVNGDEAIEVRVTLQAPDTLAKKFAELAEQPLHERQYLSRSEYETRMKSTAEQIEKVEQFAREHDLSVSKVEPGSHTVYLTGPARAMSVAFNTHLEQYELPDGTTYRGRKGALQIPEELEGIVQSVTGLDERPVARPKLRVRPQSSSGTSYKPQQVAALYSFPQPSNPGRGETVAIIELGGGFTQSDLNTYFGGKGPTVTAVSVDKAHNKPTGSADGPDGEVMLDIEVVGSIATASNIVVYFAPNTNKGFLDAISAAVHDSVRKPSVISISWGSAEDGGGYSASTLSSFNQAFQAAGVLGISVFVAAGDNGSSDGETSGNHVDFPASSPYVTACGGTRLVASNGSAISSETVWNDGAQGGATGGGVSIEFPVPTWQQGLKATKTGGTAVALTGRGVPDIAGNADPVTGYEVLIDGQSLPIGGTSAVAPLLSALTAILNQEIGKSMGFLNPSLYSLTGGATHDIVQGNNGAYEASPGWDACSGVGSPNGNAILNALKGGGAHTGKRR